MCYHAANIVNNLWVISWRLWFVGVNHKTAPVAVRECFAFDATTLPNTLQRLVDLSPAREAVILTTCNRTEVYLETDSVLEMHRWIHNHIKCYKHTTC